MNGKNVPISLTLSEVRQAAMIGVERNLEGLFLGRKHAYGMDPSRAWQNHIEGAGGEIAVAKWHNHFWSGALGDLDAADVGVLQVRTTANHGYCLILHEPARDKPDQRYILVTGMAPHYRLRGWIWARDGQRGEYWRDPTGENRAAFFVPQSALHPLPDLGALAAIRRAAQVPA